LTKPKFIIYEVDLRYGDGKSILSLGFALANTTQGFSWTDYRNRFNRRQCRANMDIRKMTEKDHSQELGWYKIYDAGQAKFIKTVFP